MRLVKYLAHAGVASRRSAETLIAAGRVSVDEQIVTDPARPVAPDSRVAPSTVHGASEPGVTNEASGGAAFGSAVC